MSIEDYKQAGFLTSVNILQARIDKAEKEVVMAYITPILPNADLEESDVRACVMELANLRLLQNSVFATRSGAKEKTTPQSYSADALAILNQSVAACDLHLQNLRTLPGANAKAKVNDICGIYFTTHYFHS